MEDNLKDKYLSAMLRFKKSGLRIPAECEIQWSELLIMEKICQDCESGNTYINVSEIQQSMYISKPAVSQTLNNLEKKGYIVREIDMSDRRKISVQPTTVGEEVLNQSSMTYEEKIRYICDQFGREDMNKLLDLLNRLSDLIDRLEKK